MKKWVFLLILFLYPHEALSQQTIKMATTTSTQDSGLLEAILPQFTIDSGIIVQVIAKGTGAAIKDGKDGNVDVILVHDTERELQFVAEGHGHSRLAVMHNDFVIVGPNSDPANIRGQAKAAVALGRIAERQAEFISRGDESGTHFKELKLWQLSGLTLDKTIKKVFKDGQMHESTVEAPSGLWYLNIGQGMGKTLIMAAEKNAYTLSDRSTFMAQKFASSQPTTLEIMVEGDELLFNPYGLILINPAKHPHVKFELAQIFAHWLVSPRGQKLIADYKLSGQQVFYPDALPDALP
ncbi:MAG: substrate-binding domain-containing protein [Candidatus Adiutrix sp.]